MAIKLLKGEKSALKELQSSPAWDVIARLFDEQVKEWDSQPRGGNNEFEVIRAVYRTEGRVEGLKEFFKKLDERAFDE